MSKKNSINSGFTLLETAIAIAILTTSMLMIYTAIARVIRYSYDNQNQLIASYLAQEGIEVVRNIRDTNWIEGATTWKDGLEAGTYRVQYDSSSLLGNQGIPLNIDTSGLYSYEAGDSSSFTRTIVISTIDEDLLRIVSEVSWPKDNGYPVSAEEFLYNWY
jgi:prepilin-type N-terminal cleavage/methylation domain-containing protein